MKYFALLFSLIFLMNGILIAQDEGAVIKRERIERDKGIFFGGGISIPGGANFGDYTTGINFEGGYMKRLNRLVSIGGSISYLNFKFDDGALSKPSSVNQSQYAEYPNFFYSSTDAFFLNLSGADLTLISINGNFKFNFVPVKDNSVISVYGFAKPFVAMAKHGNLVGVVDEYVLDVNNDWAYDQSRNTNYESDAKITGGIFLGPGLEINPTKAISIFVQASFGYTFPTDVVNSKSYSRDYENYTVDQAERFPFVTDGFTSINFAAGLAFNID